MDQQFFASFKMKGAVRFLYIESHIGFAMVLKLYTEIFVS